LTSPAGAPKIEDVMALEPRPAIGERVAAIRRRLGLTQAAFAHALGVSRNTLAKAERGHLPRARPSAAWRAPAG
jgi:DNA-binding transcriptional regulator YiaG